MAKELTLKLKSIFDTAPGWLQDWYFELRLAEEVYRAERFDSTLTLCLIELQPSLNVDGDEGIELLVALEQQFRRTDLAGITKANELAVCLVNAIGKQVPPVLERLLPVLGPHVAGYGYASFPGDATTAEGLMSSARQALSRS